MLVIALKHTFGLDYGMASLSSREMSLYFPRGLHQGDPLSLLLFAIVTEPLSRLLDGAVLAGHVSGFNVGPRSQAPLMVSHLLFADDTLIFCDALPSQIGKLREILSSLRLCQVCILI